jgi:hypothetical protein
MILYKQIASEALWIYCDLTIARDILSAHRFSQQNLKTSLLFVDSDYVLFLPS